MNETPKQPDPEASPDPVDLGEKPSAPQAADGNPSAPEVSPTADSTEIDEENPVEPSPDQAVCDAAEPESVSAPEPVPSTSSDPFSVSANLPNASVGKTYEVKLREHLFGENAERVGWFHLDPLPGGLKFAEKNETVVGPATEAGEFDLRLEYHLAGQKSMVSGHQTTVHLIINPDPRSLWTSKPSDRSGTYAKEDKVAEQHPYCSATVAAASSRGRSHARVGGYRDDHFTIRTVAPNTPEEWICVAVADGAGSASFSRQGSKVMCEKSIEEVTRKLTGEGGTKLAEKLSTWGASTSKEEGTDISKDLYHLLVGSAHEGYRKLEADVAQGAGQILKDYHTTILLTIARKLQDGRWFFASFSIGDGGVAIYRRTTEGGPKVLPLSKQDEGDFAGQTSFATMPALWTDANELSKRIHVQIVSDFTALVSMTDGISDPLFETSRSFGSDETWDRFWKILTKPSELTEEVVNPDPANKNLGEELLEWMDFFSKGNHDDRTMALILPNPGASA